MERPTPLPPPLPIRPAPAAAPLALPAVLLGVLALLLSPLLVGVLPGFAGLILAIVQLRRSPRHRQARWGAALSMAGVVSAVAWGCFYASLVLRVLPGGSGTAGGEAYDDATAAALDAQATHIEAGALADQGATKARMLSAFCLDLEDNLLACDEEGKCVRVIGPDNILKATWALDLWPQAIACRTDGSVVVAGAGAVVLVEPGGKVTASGTVPQARGAAAASDDDAAGARRRYESAVTSVAAMGADIFVCARTNTSYTIYRLSAQLDDASPIAKGLKGCCGQLDMTARDGVLYVAANSDMKVLKYDRDGGELGGFGRTGKGPEGCFEGCCEPKNLTFGSDGSLYLAGSGKCSVSHYTATGEFLEYSGRLKGIRGCVRVTVGVNRDASRIYMLDTERQVIRILARREPPAPVPTEEARE